MIILHCKFKIRVYQCNQACFLILSQSSDRQTGTERTNETKCIWRSIHHLGGSSPLYCSHSYQKCPSGLIMFYHVDRSWFTSTADTIHAFSFTLTEISILADLPTSAILSSGIKSLDDGGLLYLMLWKAGY